MHHALEIQEVLLNIFGHCQLPSRGKPGPDLPALARTCRAFKEPALDALWRELENPSPIARCLPEASRSQPTPWLRTKRYTFTRRLTPAEWVTLRSYTHRITSMKDYSQELDWESVRTFLNPSITKLLFPNLCHLACGSSRIRDLLCIPFPCLRVISLSVMATGRKDLHAFQGSLKSLFNFSPQLRNISIRLHQPDVQFDVFFSSYIRRWQNLYSLNCGGITLDMHALTHLSCMSALTDLSFTMNPTSLHYIIPADSPLTFFNLRALSLHSMSLDPISRLLTRTELPVLTCFGAIITSCPSKLDISSFFGSVQGSGIGHGIRKLSLFQGLLTNFRMQYQQEPLCLGFEDLQPSMAFSNLRRITIDCRWKVEMTGNKLLALASAWPHIEQLLINENWGWKSPGITPDELLELLRTCPSLNRVSVVIDSRGYTKCPYLPGSKGSTLSPTLLINVIDSVVEEHSVPAVAAFFASITPRSAFRLHVGGLYTDGAWVHRDAWRNVYLLAKDIVNQNLSSGKTAPEFDGPLMPRQD